MNSYKIENPKNRLKAILNSRIAKMVLFTAGVLGFAYALGGAMKVLTFTVLAFKGLVKALMA